MTDDELKNACAHTCAYLCVELAGKIRRAEERGDVEGKEKAERLLDIFFEKFVEYHGDDR